MWLLSGVVNGGIKCSCTDSSTLDIRQLYVYAAKRGICDFFSIIYVLDCIFGILQNVWSALVNKIHIRELICDAAGWLLVYADIYCICYSKTERLGICD